MAQQASLHPASTNATTQASSPPPTHYYLARYWCSGARPRNAMNLVCGKSKIREKTGLGMTVWLFLPDQGKKTTLEGERKNEREGGGGREHLSSASVQWKQVYTTLPYLITSTPHPPAPSPHRPFSSFFIFFFLVTSLNYNDSLYYTLLIGDHNRFT